MIPWTVRFQSNLDFVHSFKIYKIESYAFNTNNFHLLSLIAARLFQVSLSWLEINDFLVNHASIVAWNWNRTLERSILWFYFNLPTSFRFVTASSLNISRMSRYLHTPTHNSTISQPNLSYHYSKRYIIRWICK